MPKVQPTVTITVDEATFSVEKMSPQIKQLVMLMDEWRQEDVDLAIRVAMVKAALRDVQNNIYVAINDERKDAMAKAQALGIVPTPAPTPAPAPAADSVEAEASNDPKGE